MRMPIAESDSNGVATVSALHEVRACLASDDVQAVLVPPTADAWRAELAAAVERGDFRIERTELDGVTLDELATWLDRRLPRGAVCHATRDALLSDILDLTHLQATLTNASVHRVRIHSDAPNTRCGFHVDTVPPNTATWGVLRVFNGAGTSWVRATHIRSMKSFYEWLQAREQFVRRCGADDAARTAGVSDFDRAPAFLLEDAILENIPAGTTIVFRHVDARLHWSDHAAKLAWIHCSPMSGAPRFVVNVSSARPYGH